MSSAFYNYFENTSLSDVFKLYCGSVILFISDTITTSCETFVRLLNKSPVSSYFEDFSDFENKLLKIFLAAVLFNLLAIFIIWRISRQRICNRFLNLSTLREIEELKASVSRLKLPKEYTPRL